MFKDQSMDVEQVTKETPQNESTPMEVEKS